MHLCYFASILVFLLCMEVGNGKINYVTFSKTLTRVTSFVPKVISKTCQLKPQEGPCRANISMFYYDPESANCSTFEWGGCQGNGNRFDTFQSCSENCLSQPGQKSRPNYCGLRWDFGYCFGEDPRWFYDQKWQICKPSIYSGCGGNKNNFYNLEMCESICKYGRGPITQPTAEPPRHKAMIINPGDTTFARGLDQPTSPPHTSKHGNFTG